MQEFENVAYFDLQKTGSTTIKKALRAILDEPLLYRSVHDGPREDYDPSKPSFVSIREPVSLYISLFNFATMERMGGLYNRMRRSGQEGFYEPSVKAFERWVEFVLDPENADSLNKEYARHAPRAAIGLLSFRLLLVSMPNAHETMESNRFSDRDAIRALFGRRVWRDHVRIENLGGDFFAFLKRNEARLKLKEPLPDEADFIARLPRRNASGKIAGLSRESVSAALMQRVREREWLLYEAFGYDNDPNGAPFN